jgi:hypothetical protein
MGLVIRLNQHVVKAKLNNRSLSVVLETPKLDISPGVPEASVQIFCCHVLYCTPRSSPLNSHLSLSPLLLSSIASPGFSHFCYHIIAIPYTCLSHNCYLCIVHFH